jgi:hypothetical protein
MSGKFRTALDALAALSVTGVTHNYAVNAIPERLTRASLPILLTLPLLDGQGLRKHSEFAIMTPSGAVGVVEYYVTHLLLYAPPGQYRNVAGALPGLTDLIDNYATAIRQNSKLGGALYQPISYYALPGDVTWAGVPYLGVRFVLRLVVEV